MCPTFSTLVRLNRQKMGEAKYQREMQQATEHIKFCISLYRLQVSAGRYYLHEHPAQASSWDLKEMQEFMISHECYLTTSDMCMFGLMVQGRAGYRGLAQKPTRC